MADVLPVMPTSEARKALPSIAARFRREGAPSEPVVFGSHRKPEAALISYELYEHLLPFIEDLQLAAIVQDRIDHDEVLTFEQGLERMGMNPGDFD
ncbi:MAG: hypothetical protein R2720_04495 [Candidatus Nanopelagicales bacterium]